MDRAIQFIKYSSDYFEQCLSLFDENCPEFFADNERQDYIDFLKSELKNYFVGKVDSGAVSAFGLTVKPNETRGRLNWILVSQKFKGIGVGKKMMSFAIEAAKEKELAAIDIAASQHSAPFFEKFGAEVIKTTKDGWGAGMHKFDMVLFL